MRRYRALFLPLIILIIVKIIFLFPVFDSLEFKAQDSLYQRRGTRSLSDDVVIIGIDDATFSALNISWPFPREYHAKLIENLSLAGAKLIVVDPRRTTTAERAEIFIMTMSSLPARSSRLSLPDIRISC